MNAASDDSSPTARVAAIGLTRALLVAAGRISADAADEVVIQAIRRFDLRGEV